MQIPDASYAAFYGGKIRRVVDEILLDLSKAAPEDQIDGAINWDNLKCHSVELVVPCDNLEAHKFVVTIREADPFNNELLEAVSLCLNKQFAAHISSRIEINIAW